MVGAGVAVAIVIVFFFLAGMGFGVFWIFSRSVRIDRKPGPRPDRGSEPDEDPAGSDQGYQSWPFRH